MHPRTDEETLEALEAAIAREEEAIAALRKRTRTLEVEVTAWRSPPQPAALVSVPTMKCSELEAAWKRMHREAVLGIGIVACLATVLWALFGIGKGGHL